jgi:hypothetical protein
VVKAVEAGTGTKHQQANMCIHNHQLLADESQQDDEPIEW